MEPDRRGCVVQPSSRANRQREEFVIKAKPFDIPKREVWEAFKHVKANQGAAGVDGQSIAEFEADLSNSLYKLWNRLIRRRRSHRQHVNESQHSDNVVRLRGWWTLTTLDRSAGNTKCRGFDIT